MFCYQLFSIFQGHLLWFYHVNQRIIYITLSNHPPVDRILYDLTVDSFSFLSRGSRNSTTKTKDIYIYVHIFGLFLPSPSRRNRPSPQLVRDAVLRDIETKVRWISDDPMMSSRAKKMIMMMVFSRSFAYLLQSEPNPSKCKQFGFFPSFLVFSAKTFRKLLKSQSCQGSEVLRFVVLFRILLVVSPHRTETEPRATFTNRQSKGFRIHSWLRGIA